MEQKQKFDRKAAISYILRTATQMPPKQRKKLAEVTRTLAQK